MSPNSSPCICAEEPVGKVQGVEIFQLSIKVLRDVFRILLPKLPKMGSEDVKNV